MFQQHRVRDSARGPVRFMPSPGELETNNTCVCPDINNAGELPFLKPSECPDQIPSAEENLIFFFIYGRVKTFETFRSWDYKKIRAFSNVFVSRSNTTWRVVIEK